MIGDDKEMSDKNNIREILKWLTQINKTPIEWEEAYPIVLRCLEMNDVKVLAKSLWTIGEMGYRYPHLIDDTTFKKILLFMNNTDAKIRERAINAFGRIGRSNPKIVKPYIPMLLSLSKDINDNVRMAVIWASENIASNSPTFFEKHMKVFGDLLTDSSNRVRIEAPEIFYVIGKEHPEYIRTYKSKLKKIAEEDSHIAVRAHAQRALKTLIKDA